MVTTATGASTDLLANRTLGISASGTPDLMTLGLLVGEDERVLGAVLTPLVYHGARIAYGGRIDTKGELNFTREIGAKLAEAYRRADIRSGVRPMIHYLRAADARKPGDGISKAEKLFRHAKELGVSSEIRLLEGERLVATLLPLGSSVDVRIAGKVTAVDSGPKLDAIPQIGNLLAGDPTYDLLGLRNVMVRETCARIVLGGKIKEHSGIAQEALLTLEAGKPLLVIGGVGGASRDVGGALGLIDDADLIEREHPDPGGGTAPPWPIYAAQLSQLVQKRESYRAWAEEKGVWGQLRRLAISETPREIGALVLDVLTRSGVPD